MLVLSLVLALQVCCFSAPTIALAEGEAGEAQETVTSAPSDTSTSGSTDPSASGQDGASEGSDGQDGLSGTDDQDGLSGADGTQGQDSTDPSQTGLSPQSTDALVAQAQAEDEATGAGTAFVEGEVLVVFKDDVSSDEASETLQSSDVVKTEQVTQEELDKGNQMTTVEVADTSSVVNAAEALSQEENVEYAQPNYLYYLLDEEGNPIIGDAGDAEEETLTEDASEASAGGGLSSLSTTINDPYPSDDPYSTPSERKWWIGSVGLYDAWDYVRCDNSVSIAILDTGVNTSHEDLAANVVDSYDVTGVTGISDVNSHGTHVAGIAAARTNNGIGVAGSSYNANIVNVQVFRKTSTGIEASSADLCTAYDYVMDHQDDYNIRVVNMSLGESYGDVLQENDRAFLSKIDEANESGILTVCAAGNRDITSGTPFHDYPGDYDTCLSVMNLTKTDDLSGSSNYNEPGVTENSQNRTKDICAPGTSIYSTSGSTYSTKSGTSMASPLVAGVAALLFAEDPSLTPEEVKDILESTATDLGDPGWDARYGYGKVNAAAAVERAGQARVKGPDSMLAGGTATYSGVSRGTTLPDCVWTVENGTGSATIDSSTGVLTGISAGTVTVSFSHTGEPSCSASKTVTIYSASIDGPSEVALNESATYTITGDPSGGTWTWSVADGTGSATIDSSTGVLTGSALGTVTVRCSLADNPDVYVEKTVTVTASGLSVEYSTHVQDVGWQDWVSNGSLGGTVGRAKRVEAAKIKLVDASGNDLDGISYRAHVQNVGWQGWVSDGDIAGTTNRGLRVEAVQIKLSDSLASSYDVYYRVHVQYLGWLPWEKNGSIAGTQGMSLRVEGIEVRVVKKDDSSAQAELEGTPQVVARAHSKNVGWTAPRICDEGVVLGTTGHGLRLEAFQLNAASAGLDGSIVSQAHVATIGWMNPVPAGSVAGTTNRGKAIEAVRINLSGDLANQYDIYYRAHVSNIGWMGWAKNGAAAGTTGYGLQMEALQIKLVKKGDPAPSNSDSATSDPFRDSSQRASYTQSAKEGATQLILVEATGSDAAVSLNTREDDGTWRMQYSTGGHVGKWGIGKAREGAPVTPEGSFDLPFAFGTGDDPGTALEYHRITPWSYWIEDVGYPDIYNTWQEGDAYGEKGERLADSPSVYRYGIVIGYNDPGYLGTRRSACTVGSGSGFFLHCDNGLPTEGCVSIPPDAMLYFMQNVDPDCKIVIGSKYSIYNY